MSAYNNDYKALKALYKYIYNALSHKVKPNIIFKMINDFFYCHNKKLLQNK